MTIKKATYGNRKAMGMTAVIRVCLLLYRTLGAKVNYFVLRACHNPLNYGEHTFPINNTNLKECHLR